MGLCTNCKWFKGFTDEVTYIKACGHEDNIRYSIDLLFSIRKNVKNFLIHEKWNKNLDCQRYKKLWYKF